MPAAALTERVAAFLRAQTALPPESLLVVGVSGGVDSMVLLDVLVRLDVPVLAAHVNYGLRGAASDADEALVRERCAALGVPLEAAAYDTHAAAEERGSSVQETARDLRYAFFANAAAAAGAPAVAVAHHADDQAETVLLHLFRGTGLAGLAGMPPVRPIAAGSPILLLRPLLGARRRELEEYARAHGVPWREDAGNASDDYRRTFVRHRLLPLVTEVFDEDVGSRISRTAGFVRAYLDEVLDPAVRDAFDACSRERPDGGLLDSEALEGVQPAWRTRLILEGLARWIPDAPRDAASAARIEGLLGAQVGRRVPAGSGEVWRERDGLRFFTHPPVTESVAVEIPLAEGTYVVPGGTLTMRRANPPFDVVREDAYVAVMDAAAVATPLVVRVWHPGDAMQPLGMQGHRKVSDLLTDAKVPSSLRAAAIVVQSGEEIVWVPGVRLAAGVRVRPETTEAWVFAVERSVDAGVS